MNLNKKLIAGGLAALALMGTTAAAMAAPAYASSNVNVRSGPGSNYRVIDSLRRGERVEVDYCRGSWCYVVKSGPDGWVSANYLERAAPGRPGWDRPGRPGWDNHRPPRPDWGRPGRPGWDNNRPSRPDSSACFNGPNGYFCVGR